MALEDYHEVRDEGKTWVALDVLLVTVLQHAIDRSQRGNRLDSLLFELLLDRRSTPVLAALSQRPAATRVAGKLLFMPSTA